MAGAGGAHCGWVFPAAHLSGAPRKGCFRSMCVVYCSASEGLSLTLHRGQVAHPALAFPSHLRPGPCWAGSRGSPRGWDALSPPQPAGPRAVASPPGLHPSSFNRMGAHPGVMGTPRETETGRRPAVMSTVVPVAVAGSPEPRTPSCCPWVLGRPGGCWSPRSTSWDERGARVCAEAGGGLLGQGAAGR